MRIAVGTVVACPPHGVGRIVAREKRVALGVEQEVVVIELDEGLVVTLPLDRAREQLRAPIGKEGLSLIGETLRSDEALDDETWQIRLRQAQDKLRGGDPLELAEIVRDGVRREQVLGANGRTSKLSASERALYLRARDLLLGEIGHAGGLDQEAASAWIDEHLAPLG